MIAAAEKKILTLRKQGHAHSTGILARSDSQASATLGPRGQPILDREGDRSE